MKNYLKTEIKPLKMIWFRAVLDGTTYLARSPNHRHIKCEQAQVEYLDHKLAYLLGSLNILEQDINFYSVMFNNKTPFETLQNRIKNIRSQYSVYSDFA